MVNYICRTCLYVCASEFSFRKLDKVKPILQLFVPEIKNCTGKYSLICEQCYYFLKNVEKFKIKCMETQSKLYSMNLETIRDNHDAVLRSAANEINSRTEHQRGLPYSRKLDCLLMPKQAKNRVKKALVSATATSNSDITLTNLLKTSESRNEPHSMVYDDLLQLFSCSRGSNLQKKEKRKVNDKEVILNCNDEELNDSEGEDEYMTRKDLEAAGILPKLSDKESGKIAPKEPQSNDSEEIMEIISSEGEENEIDEEAGSTNVFKAVKEETIESENPGFFNKQSSDGFYKCRLCQKRYKTSKGLYHHTKQKHAGQIRFHHCEHCSFFTLWKSALMRHCSRFHDYIFEKTAFKCYQCAFQCRSKRQLSQHILDTHVYEKFMHCPLCRARFSDNVLFSQHVQKEH